MRTSAIFQRRWTLHLFAILVFIFVTSVTPTIIMADQVSNNLIITEEDGVTTENYPVQIGRPFLQGEIQDYPQVLIDGTPVQTQADVKQRYDDGSVKHAILSFLIPRLESNQSIKVSFSNSVMDLSGQKLTQADMLAAGFDFEALMELTNATTLSASARSMLQNGDFEYWMSGPVATSIILTDHSVQRAYDIGFDAHRSFRPIFHATFWPSINSVRVRFIGEIANTEVLQDQTYALQLHLGNSSPSPVYSKSSFTHPARSRWTKEFWIGDQPGKMSINHNLAYLTQTRFLPNFDTTRVVPESTIDDIYASWLTKPKDLYEAGFWTKSMFAGGGRPDIGLYPRWTVRWLYTGDWRMKEIAFAHADLASSWSLHYREGDNTKFFDHDSTVAGIGKIVSIAPQARPTFWTNRPDWYEIDEEDKVIAVGEMASSGWTADNAHHPDAVSPQYLLTGDFWYLEQAYFFSAYTTGNNNARGFNSTLGRGPTGSEGALYSGQVRGQGWTLRTRVHTISIAPDNHIEKTYFSLLMDYAIALWEGLYNVKGTKHEGSTLWKHGREIISASAFGEYGGVSPLNMWGTGTDSPSYVRETYIHPALVERAHAPWMVNFVLLALGRAEELGFETSALKNYLAEWSIAQFSHPGYDPYLHAAYIQPCIDKNTGEWFQSWPEVFATYQQSYITQMHESIDDGVFDTNHGYPSSGMAAYSYITDVPGGHAPWQFAEEKVKPYSGYDSDPKWALVPRVDSIILKPLFPWSIYMPAMQDGNSGVK